MVTISHGEMCKVRPCCFKLEEDFRASRYLAEWLLAKVDKVVRVPLADIEAVLADPSELAAFAEGIAEQSGCDLAEANDFAEEILLDAKKTEEFFRKSTY